MTYSAESIATYVANIISSFVITQYKRIANLPEEVESLMRDYRRMMYFLREENEKKMKDDRYKLLVFEMLDFAIKLQRLRNRLEPQLQGSEKWSRLKNQCSIAKEVEYLNSEIKGS